MAVDGVEGLQHAAGDGAVFGDGDLDGVEERSAVLGAPFTGAQTPRKWERSAVPPPPETTKCVPWCTW